MPRPSRPLLRRFVFVGLLVAQAFFVVRAYWAPHNEFGFQMFPEASQWQAAIVRVTVAGERVPVDEPWSGYVWSELVTERGLARTGYRKHAVNGLDSQLAFLADALDWVADHTPDDRETRYYEAVVTAWHNDDPPETTVLRSKERVLP